MLKGQALGKAIKEAIDMKLAKGTAPSKAAIARHFGVKPPSLHDWINKGSIAKDKLPELWRYFADVVGPEHWGLTSMPIAVMQDVPGYHTLSDDERWLVDAFRAADPHMRDAMMSLTRSVIPERPPGLHKRTGT